MNPCYCAEQDNSSLRKDLYQEIKDKLVDEIKQKVKDAFDEITLPKDALPPKVVPPTSTPVGAPIPIPLPVPVPVPIPIPMPVPLPGGNDPDREDGIRINGEQLYRTSLGWLTADEINAFIRERGKHYSG